MSWSPTQFIRYEDYVPGSSTKPAIIMTDQGRAYLKAINNPIGPHALIREWVGTKLAGLFHLDTFDLALLNINIDDEIPLGDGNLVSPGYSVIARGEKGHPWGGEIDELKFIENPDSIPRLVVFDTWTRNRDRHPPVGISRRSHRDNVFFSEENAQPGLFRLIAMDHTECFIPTSTDLNPHICQIDNIQDRKVYGLFDAFQIFMQRKEQKISLQKRFLASINDLEHISSSDVESIIRSIPGDWDINFETKNALKKLILERAEYISDNFRDILGSKIWPGEIIF